MRAFSLLPLLLASSLTMTSVLAISTHIRGSTGDGQGYELSSNRHRHLLQESLCTLFRKCISYGPTEEHPYGHDEHLWVCKLSNEDAKRLNLQYVDIVESSTVAAILEDAIPSSSIMTMSEAVIDIENPQMYIPKNAHVEVHNYRFDKERAISPEGRTVVDDWFDQNEKAASSIRKGPPTTGKLRTLVVRLTDGDNVSVTASLNQLKDDVFYDSASLKTQIEACSYGKLKIEPFKGHTPNNKYISDGVVDVSMDYVMTSGAPGKDDAAKAAINQQLGDIEDPMFDLIMICFPPGSPIPNFIASASANTKFSYYNDEWCSYVSSQMHEVGHNIGLGHSGESGGDELHSTYGDKTGIMGFSDSIDDQRICYNPQKNYQLGWYDNKVDTINPLDGVSSREYTLNGVSDYKRSNDALVVLRLEQVNIQNKDYYIGYNRADGINKDTREDPNMVTISRKEVGAADEYGLSTKFAALNPGERYVIKDFDNKKDVTIQFIGLINGNARIVVLEGDKQAPPPPGNCQEFTIEVTTDKFPEDTFWNIIDTEDIGYVGGNSPVYTQVTTEKKSQVCLPMGKNPKTYKFTIYDRHGDGLTNGNGSYKIKNYNGQVLVSEDDGKFSSRTHDLKVDKDPNPPPPTQAPTQASTAKPTSTPSDDRCEDEKTEKEKFRIKEGGRKNNCKFYSKRDKCDEMISTGDSLNKLVWEVCEKSCNRCAPLDPDDGCKDEKTEKEKFRIKEGGQKNNCKFYSKRDKCDEMISTGDSLNKLVWEVCEKSCNRCSPSGPHDTCKDEKKERQKFRIKEDGQKNNCKFYAKFNKCNEKISTGKNQNKHVWELCKNSCNRC